MDDKVIEIIKKDIERCEKHTTNEGSYELYQALIGKYNGLFDRFSDDIPKSGKASAGGAFNYRPELNAIKEKLELILVTEQTKDPLFKFKEMLPLLCGGCSCPYAYHVHGCDRICRR